MAELFRGVKAWRSAEQAGGVAEESALERNGLRGEAERIEGDGVVLGGTATAADGLSGVDEQRGEAVEFGLPEGFLVAGERGHVGEVFADLGVPLFEFREQLMADAVAGEGRVAVGGVFAPGLSAFREPSLDLGAANGQHGAEDFAGAGLVGADFSVVYDGKDCGDAFGPGSAEELGEDGLGLVVEGVSSGDGIDNALSDESLEPVVAEAAGGLLDSLPCQRCLVRGVGALDVAAEA